MVFRTCFHPWGKARGESWWDPGGYFPYRSLGNRVASRPVFNPPQGPSSGLRGALGTPKPDPEVAAHPNFTARRKAHEVQLTILWHEGFAEDGVSLLRGREMMQRNENIFLKIIIVLLFLFPFFLLTLHFPQAVAGSSPRQRHLSRGLFLPSLFGIALSSRTKPRPINNSSLRSCSLPPSLLLLLLSLVSLHLPFSLPRLALCLQRGDALRTGRGVHLIQHPREPLNQLHLWHVGDML